MNYRVEIETVERSPRIKYVTVLETSDKRFAWRYASSISRPVNWTRQTDITPHTRVVDNGDDSIIFDTHDAS
jgi:hypothetical protein